ncbi:hypothetical protein HDR59_02340 [bacterium]|nr:hypothetical protein [bacterium]
MLTINGDTLYKMTKLIYEFERDKGQSSKNIQKKNLDTTSIVDISDYGKVKIHITMDAYNIIEKNMDSGKVDTRPIMCFLKEENIKNDTEFNNRFKKAQDDAKLYGIVHIDIAFNDMKTLEKLSEVKVDEYYHLFWIEASIAYIKHLLNNKQLGLEYSTKLIKEVKNNQR